MKNNKLAFVPHRPGLRKHKIIKYVIIAKKVTIGSITSFSKFEVLNIFENIIFIAILSFIILIGVIYGIKNYVYVKKQNVNDYDKVVVIF